MAVIVITALLLPLLRIKRYAAYAGSAVSALLAVYWIYSSFTYSASTGEFIFDNLTIVVAVASFFAGSIIMLSYAKLDNKSNISSSLLLIGILGTILVASTINPLVILASWGLLSIASYGIAAIPKDKRSLTNALKYAFMGGLSFQFLIIAVLLVFSYSTILVAALLGFSLFIVAIGFKVGAVPFHMWLPDVYGSSNPLAVSALSAIMKLGPLALTLRLQ
jgi:NADH:ubiquinone oxidoreductase subunit 2 (subunit N)